MPQTLEATISSSKSVKNVAVILFLPHPLFLLTCLELGVKGSYD